MFTVTLLAGIVLIPLISALVVISDNHSFTSKSCTKQNLYLQEVMYYYRYQGVEVSPLVTCNSKK
jgi:hypothetical protein